MREFELPEDWDEMRPLVLLAFSRVGSELGMMSAAQLCHYGSWGTCGREADQFLENAAVKDRTSPHRPPQDRLAIRCCRPETPSSSGSRKDSFRKCRDRSEALFSDLPVEAHYDEA
jgi:hypothetical protein